jgi:thioredoxin reductase
VFVGFTLARLRQRRVAIIVGGALAAGLAAVALTRLDLGLVREGGHSSPFAEFTSRASMVPGFARQEAPVLAAQVRVVPGGDAPGPSVLGPWDIGLAPGTYVVEVDDHPGDELRVRTAGGGVEVRSGRVHILVGADRTEARLEHGVATWVAPLGDRRPLTATPAPTP